jgi:hypothetical protein
LEASGRESDGGGALQVVSWVPKQDLGRLAFLHPKSDRTDPAHASGGFPVLGKHKLLTIVLSCFAGRLTI